MAKKKARPVKVKVKPRLGTARQPYADLDPGALVLQGKPIPVPVSRAVQNMTLEQTRQGASTLVLTVSDYSGALLKSQLLKGKVSLVFDRVPFVLVKVEKGERQVILSFEEEAVNVLRQYDTPRKALRNKVTRAQFVRSLITEPKEFRIPYRIPEVNQRQPQL